MADKLRRHSKSAAIPGELNQNPLTYSTLYDFTLHKSCIKVPLVLHLLTFNVTHKCVYMVVSYARNNVSHSQLLIIDLHAKWIEKNKTKKNLSSSPSDSNVYLLNDIL